MNEVLAVAHRAGVPSRAERATHVITAPLLTFDLAAELDALRRERPYVDGDRNGKTLAKEGRHRVVLAALKAGARFDEGDPRGYLTIAVREGRFSVTVDGGETEVGAGEIAVLGHGQCWSGRALEDSALLMNFSWPPERS
jgi:quercetin dioxygenase-like cupin family protein